MITSLSNEKVKQARSLSQKKNRSAYRRFLVEGVRVIEEADRAGNLPALVFYEPAAVGRDQRAHQLLARLREHAAPVEPVSESVLHSLAQTEAPQGLVAVYPFPELSVPERPALALVLDSVRDPGNLGTILRTGWAAGVDIVFLAPDTADAYNPKVVRAAMGAHFFVPIRAESWPRIAGALRAVPRIYLADPRGETRYTEADWTAPCALIVGGEAEGAGAEARELATALLAIPMPGDAESLNASVAAAVLLFEAIRYQGAARHPL